MGSTAFAPALDATEGLTVFVEGRRRLFGIAYRILRSPAEAEDVVQEVWLRWQLCDRTRVREPMAYLATTTTRAAINVLQSARVRHETSMEPLLERPAVADDPAVDLEREEALEQATYLMMERLTPSERAAFVLRVGFDYPYARIAVIIATTEAAARQLVSRARKRLAVATERAVDRAAHQRLVRAFRNAARGGDAAMLENVLTEPSSPCVPPAPRHG
ncbi:sigma-70 family RNA polymerase sigma factor [Agromyces sp. CFH 90414]|uniref:Sigma-70 family RNA polymerase sigma factor n=1 Tax=Agromyces agglutinans TaxID=2662258 RepID=A0A6I2F4J6_9MICO|nr:sigma-70 family RNA polymerase sigma factor [Agromyces agglutinans]MRG60395.1 sigma-70 family RNA polymerase sigma factor [Agromyces agglutinans]